MQQLLKDIFTGKDGETYDVGRILWFIFGLSFIVFSAVELYHGGHFSANDFGLGSGSLLGGGGVGIGLKGKTEPE